MVATSMSMSLAMRWWEMEGIVLCLMLRFCLKGVRVLHVSHEFPTWGGGGTTDPPSTTSVPFTRTEACPAGVPAAGASGDNNTGVLLPATKSMFSNCQTLGAGFPLTSTPPT